MSLFNFFKKSEEETHKDNKLQPFYEQEELKLPENFAQTVMDLEMQMEFV